MFILAILIGVYSYIIFGLGLLGALYKSCLVLATFAFGLLAFYFYRKKIKNEILRYFTVLKQKVNIKITKRNWLLIVVIFILVLQGTVNFIGVLGPELGFDALWYHLTLPKIYLQNHSIFYIPGGLLYYSAMPKLTEMLYIAGLAFGNEVFAKLMHYFFGILSMLVLYNLSRKFLSKTYSFLVLALFYSNLVAGWMSITAYVDLTRTFFEVMALWGLVEWFEKKKKKWLILSAVMLGLAVSAKLLALGSLLIFSILIIIFTRKITNIFIYSFFALLIPLPWFIFSYIHTGSPIYPFFSNIYPVKVNFSLFNPLTLSDPISPLYIIFLPLIIFFYKRVGKASKVVFLYSFLAIIVFYLSPQTGGGRFVLPYLPAFSLIAVVVINKIRKVKLRYVLISSIIFFGLFSIVYRGAANLKYIPAILGKESKSQFLSRYLNFSFGDFYDIDGYFEKKIKMNDKVLLYGFHNLYYINFPFIDSSFVKKGDLFNYIAVQKDSLPKRFKFWKLIYYNNKTNVKLYSLGGIKWTY